MKDNTAVREITGCTMLSIDLDDHCRFLNDLIDKSRFEILATIPIYDELNFIFSLIKDSLTHPQVYDRGLSLELIYQYVADIVGQNCPYLIKSFMPIDVEIILEKMCEQAFVFKTISLYGVVIYVDQEPYDCVVFGFDDLDRFVDEIVQDVFPETFYVPIPLDSLSLGVVGGKKSEMWQCAYFFNDDNRLYYEEKIGRHVLARISTKYSVDKQFRCLTRFGDMSDDNEN